MSETLRIYVDSNVLIYAVEGEPIIARSTQRLLLEAARRRVPILTSELTLAEVLAKPERDRRPDRTRAFLEVIDDNPAVLLMPVTRAILTESASYRSKTHRRPISPGEDRRNFLPDAIHVVTALKGRATTFVSRDGRIRVPSGMELMRCERSAIELLIGRL